MHWSVFTETSTRLQTLLSGAVTRHRTVMNLSMQQPTLGQDVFVAPSAAVIGDVSLGTKASVWYGCVLKGKYGDILCIHGSRYGCH